MHSSTIPPLLRGPTRVAIRQPSEQKKKQVKTQKTQNSWASDALRLSKNADAWFIENKNKRYHRNKTEQNATHQ
jgi:hypothetical protein